MDWDQRRRVAGRLQHRREQYEPTRPVAITCNLLLMERGPDDGPRHVRTIEFARVVIDPTTHSRWVRKDYEDDQEKLELFDEMFSIARQVPIDIQIHPGQLEVIDSVFVEGAKETIIQSGARAGKSQIAAIILLLLWLVQGFDGAAFWWLSASLKQAHEVCVKALVIGHGPQGPPLIPPGLVLSWPKTHRSSDQQIRMIDGSEVHLFHAQGEGGNLRGPAAQAVVIDEYTAIRNVENYQVAITRTLTTRGPVILVSTPGNNHWGSQILARAKHDKAIRAHKFTCFDNPWAPTDETRRLINSLGGEDSPVVRREIYGEDVRDGTLAFPSWDSSRGLRLGEHARSCEAFGLTNITAQAASSHWRRGAERYIGGQDFNVNPMTTVLLQVCVEKGQSPGDPENWIILALDEPASIGKIEAHAVHLTDHLRRHYKSGPIPLACDATSAMHGTSPSQSEWTAKNATNVKVLRAYGFDAVACWFRVSAGKPIPTNPPQTDSLNLMDWMFRRDRILVHERCLVLRQALSDLGVTDDGRIAKQPGGPSDRLSAPVDAFRYAIWSIMHRHWLGLLKRDERERRPVLERV